MQFQYLIDRYEFCLIKFFNPENNFKLKPCSAYFGDGAMQSWTNMVVVTSDCPPSSHQTAPPPQSDVGQHGDTYVEPSSPPDITPFSTRTDLVVSPIQRHMFFYLILHLRTRMILLMKLSCVFPFRTLHLL